LVLESTRKVNEYEIDLNKYDIKLKKFEEMIFDKVNK